MIVITINASARVSTYQRFGDLQGLQNMQLCKMSFLVIAVVIYTQIKQKTHKKMIVSYALRPFDVSLHSFRIAKKSKLRW